MSGLPLAAGLGRQVRSAAGLGAVVVALDGSPAAATALPLARAVARQLAARVEALHVAASWQADRPVQALLARHLDDSAVVHTRWAVGDPVVGILDAVTDPDVELVVLATHGRALGSAAHLGQVATGVIVHTPRRVLLVRPEAAHAGPEPGALRRWLLPLDGTPTTATALQPATELAWRLGASIDLLYVLAPGQPRPTERGSIGVPRYVDQPHHEWSAWEREVDDRLCRGLARCPPDVPVRLHLAQGESGPAIVAFAAAHETDVIALVRRSQLEPGRAATLRAVLDGTPCPILLCAAARA